MLFGRKKCSKCQSEYDVVLDTCPVCHAPDEEFENRKVDKKLLWLPLVRQILLFAIGWLGLRLLGLAAELIAMPFIKEVNVHYYMFVNGIRYAGTLIAMIIVLWNQFPRFRKFFNRAAPYLLGLAGGAALLGATIAYNLIVNIFYQPTANQNQTVANEMVSTYPILCILLLGIAGPLVEELTYRVGLYTFFCRINKYLAYAITIVVFGLIHFNFFAKGDDMINELVNLPSYMISGFLLTLWYDKFGLASSCVAHIFNNLYSVLMTILSNWLKTLS